VYKKFVYSQFLKKINSEKKHPKRCIVEHVIYVHYHNFENLHRSVVFVINSLLCKFSGICFGIKSAVNRNL
jgi:hypothetical protein